MCWETRFKKGGVIAGSKEDSVNEPAAANMEPAHSGSKELDGTMFWGASAVTVREKSALCGVLSSYSGKSLRKI